MAAKTPWWVESRGGINLFNAMRPPQQQFGGGVQFAEGEEDDRPEWMKTQEEKDAEKGDGVAGVSPEKGRYQFLIDDAGNVWVKDTATGEFKQAVDENNNPIKVSTAQKQPQPTRTEYQAIIGKDGSLTAFDKSTGQFHKVVEAPADPSIDLSKVKFTEIESSRPGKWGAWTIDGVPISDIEQVPQVVLPVSSYRDIPNTDYQQGYDLRGDPVGPPIRKKEVYKEYDKPRYVDLPNGQTMFATGEDASGRPNWTLMADKPPKVPISAPWNETVRDASGTLRTVTYQWAQMPDGRTAKINVATGEVAGDMATDESLQAQMQRTITQQKLGRLATPTASFVETAKGEPPLVGQAGMVGIPPTPQTGPGGFPFDFSGMTKIGSGFSPSDYVPEGSPGDIAYKQSQKDWESQMIGWQAAINAGLPGRINEEFGRQQARKRAAIPYWAIPRQR